MTLPALLTAFTLVAAQEPTPYTDTQAVAAPTRLAMTPVIDGSITADEWDMFTQTSTGEAFLQWEPGRLYVAGRIPVDSDLVISLDNKQNGWLVGKDNLEFRLRVSNGRAFMLTRQLDATNVAGPRWVSLPAFDRAAVVAGKSDGTEAQIEAAIVDPGLGLLPIKDGERYMVRMDIVAQSAQATEPFYPRVGKVVTLRTERASAMPVGLDWKVENPGRTVTPGGSTKVRFSFSTKEDVGLQKIEIKPLGPLANHAATLGQPFPSFDSKGRTFVDYEAKTGRDAPTGYHLVSSILTTSDGAPAMIQASLRIAPLVDFSLADERIELKQGVQEIKIPFYIKSNTVNRLDGTCDVEVPVNWEALKGDDKGFIIYNSRASVRRVLTVKLPADAEGTLPLRFRAKIGDRTVEEIRWITVRRK